MTPIVLDTEGGPVELGEGRGDLRTSSVPFTQWDGGSLYGNRPVSFAQVFATQPWIAIAVMRLLTWAIRVPLKAYRITGDEGERERLRPGEHPLADALASPWKRGSQAQLVMGLLGPLCVHGNALLPVIEGARGKILFEELDWRTVTVTRMNNNNDPFDEIVAWNVHRPGQSPVPYSSETTMHLRWWSPLGSLGVSPLQQLRSTIIAEKAAVEWSINNLKQAARPSGVVEISDEALKLKPELRQALYEQAVSDFRDNYGGEQNAGKLPVLPPGLSWTSATHTTAVEAALKDQRMINRNESAAMFMLPPPTIGQLERATFNNIMELRQMAYTDGLAPPLVLIENLMNSHLIRDLLRETDICVEFDFGLILRGDRLKEIKALREGISSGLYTPNEGRRALNLPPSDATEADELFMPTNNLAPLGSKANEA